MTCDVRCGQTLAGDGERENPPGNGVGGPCARATCWRGEAAEPPRPLLTSPGGPPPMRGGRSLLIVLPVEEARNVERIARAGLQARRCPRRRPRAPAPSARRGRCSTCARTKCRRTAAAPAGSRPRAPLPPGSARCGSRAPASPAMSSAVISSPSNSSSDGPSVVSAMLSSSIISSGSARPLRRRPRPASPRRSPRAASA